VKLGARRSRTVGSPPSHFLSLLHCLKVCRCHRMAGEDIADDIRAMESAAFEGRIQDLRKIDGLVRHVQKMAKAAEEVSVYWLGVVI
jgi:hypothetical protein